MERDKALEAALGQIEKQFGKGAVMRMGEHLDLQIEAISTGAMALDLALGIGGLPRGRVVEVFGPESSGKSTLALHVVAEAQRNGGVCAYVDAEHALDPVYASAIGVDVDQLLISQPDTGEQALEIADLLIRSGAIDVIVIDSVAALTPRAEIEGEMGDTHVGLQARLMSQALRKLTATLNKSDTIALFINQLREKIGVMWGSPETTPGGRALKFYASIRLDIRRVESIKDGAEVVGNRTRVKVVKNKCVAEGTRVFDPSTGLTHRIEEIVEGGSGAAVVAADKAGKLHIRPIIERMDQGEHEVIGLRLRDGTVLRVTADHKVLTDTGWRAAGELRPGDRLARPRQAIGFGSAEPLPPEQARLLGYMIGNGCITEKAPISSTGLEPQLQADRSEIVGSLGCEPHLEALGAASCSVQDSELNLARWAGLYGHRGSEKQIPAAFFAPEVSSEVIGNLLFGIWESGGYVRRRQGALCCGIITPSEQLASQLHWSLLRWSITSSVERRETQDDLCWYDLSISGIDNLERFEAALPMWGPKGRQLTVELAKGAAECQPDPAPMLLPSSATAPVLAYLERRGVSAQAAARLVARAGGDPLGATPDVLERRHLRRDRVRLLADSLQSDFLAEILDEDLWYDEIQAIEPAEWCRIFDVEVAEDHTFVADGVVVSNCSAPFRSAEFDIMYGKGISREGSILDVAVDLGIVKKAGAWYTYEGEQIGQGRENAKQFLRDSPELVVEIDERIRNHGKEVAIEVPLGMGAGDDEPITLE